MIVDFPLVLPYTLGGIDRPMLMVFFFVMRKVGGRFIVHPGQTDAC